MKHGANPGWCRGFSVLLTLIWLTVLPGVVVCQPEPAPGAATMAPGDWNLTIFHTNDMHGAFLPEPASWREDGAEVGGMIALAWHLEQERRTAAPSLLLDAGDFMTGNPICQIEVEGVKGAGFMKMMNAVGYDAGVIGNHEFDNGRANSRALATVASFPLLAADILDEAGEHAYAHEPLVLTRGELTIGVMGVSCAGLFEVTAADHTAGLSLRNQALAVRELIATLDPVTDLLVLITHNGFSDDKELARELEGSGLDIIVGGHSHTRLKEPAVEGGIIIVQAGSHLKNLGRLDLRVADDQVAAHAGRLIQLTAAGTSAGEELTTLVESYQREVNEVFGRVIGTLATEWRRGEGESNIGSWLADRVRERAGAELAFLNSGTIRKDLAAGPIRLLDIHEILPFTNTLVTFDLTGEEILTLLTTNAVAQAYRRYGILQVSGVRYGFRQVGDHVEVEQVTVGEKPLVRDRVYRVAAPDYVVMKAERYFGFPVPEFTPLGVYLTETIVAAVTVADTVYAETDGRIRDLTGTGESK
jgi:2',3'-cyclic-nucleotide 2'-phosphodiesterase (5'-nucleotidase family)